MPISTADCWKLIAQSRLLTEQQCQLLSAQYERSRSDQQNDDGDSLLNWLVAQQVFSSDHAEVLKQSFPSSADDRPARTGSVPTPPPVAGGARPGKPPRTDAATSRPDAAPTPTVHPRQTDRPTSLNCTVGDVPKDAKLRPAYSRAKTKRSSTLVIVGTALAAATLAISLVGLALSRLPSRAGSHHPQQATPGPPESSGQSTGGHQQTTEPPDDSNLLWASPTNGQAVQLRLLPAGAQIILIARLSQLAHNEEGRRVLRALGPDFQHHYARWEAASGLTAEEIEQVVVGLYGNQGQFPRVAAVIQSRSPLSSHERLRSWGDPKKRTANGAVYYAGPEWAYLIPPDGDRRFVMGHEREITNLADSDLAAPLLRRDMAKLLSNSDESRHLNLLFAPNFLLTDGLPLFAGRRRRALEQIERFLGDGLTAGFLSLHFAESLSFLEMRVTGDVAIGQLELATKLQARLVQLVDAVDVHIADLNPDPYWQSVALRYPAMVRFLRQQTRVGVEGGTVVLNAALPPAAPHNLVFGAEMLLASDQARASHTAPPEARRPDTIEQALTAKLSISFDQESLEFAVQAVEREFLALHRDLPFRFEIRIAGGDLQREGITRNQQIRNFLQREKTLAQILNALVREANPVPVEKLSDSDQKLVWAIGANPETPGEQAIWITVRQIAKQKYVLPEVFRAE